MLNSSIRKNVWRLIPHFQQVRNHKLTNSSESQNSDNSIQNSNNVQWKTTNWNILSKIWCTIFCLQHSESVNITLELLTLDHFPEISTYLILFIVLVAHLILKKRKNYPTKLGRNRENFLSKLIITTNTTAVKTKLPQTKRWSLRYQHVQLSPGHSKFIRKGRRILKADPSMKWKTWSWPSTQICSLDSLPNKHNTNTQHNGIQEMKLNTNKSN